MKALLVAENPRIAEQVKTALLGRPDADVFRVTTPQRAVALLDEAVAQGEPERYAVVIGDNDTHPTGGYFLAREVKARGQMGQTMPPVILLLARADDRWLANWSQADAYVVKPVDPFNLREVVDAVVEGAPVPALPGVGSDPTPSPLDLPGGETETSGLHAGGGLTGGGP